ncbi:MAG: hypothetical protein JSR26_03885 [Proteobacteria bacterium]|nr:hypothetical protein [Pseudomonadota bacterium]
MYTDLVAGGHRFERLGNYTARQLMLFHDRLHARDGRRRATRIVDVNLGFAGGKAAKDAVTALQED